MAVYVIELNVGPYNWTVRHRYSKFHDLNEKLVTECNLDRTLLPPKKLFGNQTEAFIRRRQSELELYLQAILQHLQRVPIALANFLGFDKYEIHGITQALAEELFHKGDEILESRKTFVISPLQLHAVTRRLRLPEPTCDCGDAKKDIGHILDFLTRLRFLKIVGTDKGHGNSNIVPNELNYDLSMFKSLESLELVSCTCENISGVDYLKKTLKRLEVEDTIRSVKDVLLLGIGQGQWMGGSQESLIVPAWASLTSANFSKNDIRAIDESVKLMPRISKLDLSRNLLEDIQQLQFLSTLTYVDLSYNSIKSLNSLHTKLGNITTLNLSDNAIGSLQGFSKLYSLESLDVSNNDISQVLEVRHICRLPCLEKLNLVGNPVTIVVDYRTKIFELFMDRAKEIVLDEEKASQKELDTVAILLAIQKSKAKETGDPAKKTNTKKPAVEANIAEVTRRPGQGPTEVVGQSERDGGQAGGRPEGGWSEWDPDEGIEATCQQFRRQVMAIREHGGSMWLASLNQMHSPLLARRRRRKAGRKHARGAKPRTQAEASDTSQRTERAQTLCVPRVPQNLSDSQSMASESSAGDVSLDAMGFMLPDTLPGRADTGFTAQLQSLVPNVLSLSLHSGTGEGEHPRRREERTQHVMWCCALCYTDPGIQFPACVYTTTENLHLFQVHSLNGRGGNPELEHMYTIPLVNIQQVILGYQEVYLRIEEAFSGPQGTYALLTYSPQKTEDFMHALRAAIRRAIPDTEHYEEPHIMVNGETELALKAVLNRVELLSNLASLPIRLYMLVQAPGLCKDITSYATHSLVLTHRHLYLVQEDYILWPQPTFGIGPSTKPRFEILQHYPIAGRITGIQMYDSDTYCRRGLPENFTATGSSASISSNFIGFGVRLTFEMGGQSNREFDIRVPTSGMRDRFLATLTHVRRELSERSPGARRRLRKLRHVETKEKSQERSSKASSASDTSSSQSFVSLESEKETGDSNGNLGDVSESSGASAAIEHSDEDKTDCIPEIVLSTTSTLVSSLASPVFPDVQYPTMDLLVRLSHCNENMPLLKKLSEPLQNLALMTGEELLNLFHSSVAQIASGGEELQYALWTAVTPYQVPRQEIITCILLSNKFLYFVSDDSPQHIKKKLPIWKTHHRNHSDGNVMYEKTHSQLPHHSSGILHTSNDDSKKHLRSYFTIPLSELNAVHIGMFDQSFRFTGKTPSQVYSCITRDTALSEQFIKQLMMVLSTLSASPLPEEHPSEADFYQMFNRYSRCESLEFMHPSSVKFAYPSEEAVAELIYVLKSNFPGKNQINSEVSILLFLLLFQVDTPEGTTEVDYSRGMPRSIVVTEQHVALLQQDHVSYPLPDFAVGLPDTANYEAIKVKSLKALKRVVVSDFTSHDLALVFEDEVDLVVDATLEYYTEGEYVDCITPPEVSWTLVIQNLRDRDRLLKLLQRQWSELNEGRDLSVQVNA